MTTTNVFATLKSVVESSQKEIDMELVDSSSPGETLEALEAGLARASARVAAARAATENETERNIEAQRQTLRAEKQKHLAAVANVHNRLHARILELVRGEARGLHDEALAIHGALAAVMGTLFAHGDHETSGPAPAFGNFLRDALTRIDAEGDGRGPFWAQENR